MIIWIIVLAIYLIGAFVAWGKIKSWNNKTYEKIGATIIWPLIGILYGIHWLNNQ